jgi:hypothetical protein
VDLLTLPCTNAPELALGRRWPGFDAHAGRKDCARDSAVGDEPARRVAEASTVGR